MRITRHIHMLNMPFSIPVAPGVTVERSVNIFLIEYRKKFCLVDAGVAGSEGAIFSYLGKLGFTPDHIQMLVLTHAHPDHVGAARAIREATGCIVAAHRGDRRWIEDTGLQERERPVPGFHALVDGPVQVDRELVDGEAMELGRLTIETFHTPGHSRGSISLFVGDDRALITGDAVPVPGEPPIYEDAAESRNSVECLADLPGVAMLLSSWDEPCRGVREVARKFEKSLEWMERVRDMVRRVKDGGGVPEMPDFAGRVLSGLGLSQKMVNPLTTRTLVAEFVAAQKDGAI